VPYLPVNGVTLHYEIDSQSGGPWVTLSNSLLTDLSMWDPQVAALRPRFRILRYDQRGHGSSELGGASLTFELLSDDLATLLQALRINRSHIVGSSMGGTTGVVLAATRPELVSSVLVAGSRPSSTPESSDGWLDRIARTAGAEGMRLIVEETIQRWFTAATGVGAAAWFRQMRAVMDATPAASYVAVARLLADYDVRGYYSQVQCPLLFVGGAHDPGAAEILQATAARIQGSTFYAVPGAGHVPSAENAAYFTQALTAFLDRTDSGWTG
jgi:3-oxoadipate enol-lactonase